MPVPKGPFAEVMDDALGSGPAFDLMHLGAASNAVHNYTGSEALTRPLIANFVWQSFIGHPIGLDRLVAIIKQAHPHFVLRRTLVIWHGANPWSARCDLLVLGTGLRDPEHDMFITELSFTQQEAVHGWVAFAGKHGEGFAREGAMFSHFNPADIAGVACASQGSTSNFKVLVMEAPAMESTSRVPNAPLRVVSDKGEISTAGVIATRAGDLGVTAALHAVQDSTGRGPTVDGNTAKVVSQDVLSDSAFLVPSDTGLLAGPAATPLSGLVPRMFEDVSFSGVISGHTKGQIRGVDPRLPFVSSKAQLVVTTDLITAKGDSGAALVDTSGNVLGFAHERSLASARNPYSSWIWADLVFAVHGLT